MYVLNNYCNIELPLIVVGDDDDDADDDLLHLDEELIHIVSDLPARIVNNVKFQLYFLVFIKHHTHIEVFSLQLKVVILF